MSLSISIISILFSITFEGFEASFTTCPDGWVAEMGSCYLFVYHNKVSFTEAEHYCRQHFDSHLVHIDSNVENVFIKEYLRRLDGKESWWLGATDEAVEGNWKWFDTNTNLTVTDWFPGRPDNSQNDDCLIMYQGHDYRWDDVPCLWTYEPICELKSEPVGEVVGR